MTKKKFVLDANKSYEDITSADALAEALGQEAGSAVIDLWGPSCGPCMAMAPQFEAVAEHYGDEPVSFYKINTESQPELARQFNIRSVPTILFVHDGEILDVLVGACDGHRLSKRVDWLMAKARGDGFLKRLFGGSKRKSLPGDAASEG